MCRFRDVFLGKKFFSSTYPYVASYFTVNTNLHLCIDLHNVAIYYYFYYALVAI